MPPRHYPIPRTIQKGVRLSNEEDKLYTELARRMDMADRRTADGFAELARVALRYFVENHPEAAEEAKRIRGI